MSRNRDRGCMEWAIIIFFVLLISGIVLKLITIVGALALIVASVVFPTRQIYQAWKNHHVGEDTQALRNAFGQAIRQQTQRSHQDINAAIEQWKQLQSSKGIGAALEQAYYDGGASFESKQLIYEINSLLRSAQDASEQLTMPLDKVGAQERIHQLHRADELTMKLKEQYQRVTEES